ncbi:MAG: nitroreductase [Syntrophaceae bacterium]|nr:nitroreductase [Syntrophaceae bacterium]
MNISEAIRKRKSIREFKPDPVPRDILREILETAGRAPSAMNTQPWKFLVVTGDALERIKKENVEKLRAGEIPKEEHPVVGWSPDSVYRKRQVALAMQLFERMGIRREDKEERARWLERGFRFFDAPAAIILLTDRALLEGTCILDVGAVMQSICLAALEHGLGTCIEDQGVMYPDVVRKHGRIPDSDRIVIAIAIGYPNPDFPANRLESPREPVDSITVWSS